MERKDKAAQPVPRAGGLLQRRCACGGTPGPDGECAACKAKRLAAAPFIVSDVLRAPGRPLDAATRAFMEPHFGHDFSRVRVHTDGPAAESARAVDARAYTVGRSVVFGAGQYAPETEGGRKLLAHELAHTLQQGMAGEVAASRLRIAPPDDAHEHEANRAAAGLKGAVSSGAAAGLVQRQPAPQPQRTGDCSGWESDKQSFAKVIADHYVRTQLGREPGAADTIECPSKSPMCAVKYADGTEVWTTTVKVPDHVIARERVQDGIRCEYDYDCTPNGQVVFTQRGDCRPS
jgi:hypothetical protein